MAEAVDAYAETEAKIQAKDGNTTLVLNIDEFLNESDMEISIAEKGIIEVKQLLTKVGVYAKGLGKYFEIMEATLKFYQQTATSVGIR